MNFLLAPTEKEPWASDGSQEVLAAVRSLLLLTVETVAGALESLSALAHAHLEIGVASPFLVSLYK